MKLEDKTLSQLDKQLWKLFSLYVRQNHANENGHIVCITCGVWRHWKACDAGHYLSRRHKITKFDEYNVFPQCKQCNGPGGGGKPEEYKKFLDLNYPGHSERLEALIRKPVKFDKFDYIRLINHYKDKLKEKGFQTK